MCHRRENLETLFRGLADARAGKHEFRGRHVSAEPLLNPVPTTSAASTNPRKTAWSRERRAYQNVQQSPKNATGTDFENAGAVPEMTKNRCPGACRGSRGAPGQVSRDAGTPPGRAPGTPPGRPGTPRTVRTPTPQTPSRSGGPCRPGGFWSLEAPGLQGPPPPGGLWGFNSPNPQKNGLGPSSRPGRPKVQESRRSQGDAGGQGALNPKS